MVNIWLFVQELSTLSFIIIYAAKLSATRSTRIRKQCNFSGIWHGQADLLDHGGFLPAGRRFRIRLGSTPPERRVSKEVDLIAAFLLLAAVPPRESPSWQEGERESERGGEREGG